MCPDEAGDANNDPAQTETGTRTHRQSIQDQFNPQSGAYLASPVHAKGPDLDRAAQLVTTHVPPTAQILDAGSGAGHLSFTLAPLCQRVIAVDPSPNMLRTVAEESDKRGLSAIIETREAAVEALPFQNAEFDLVATRYSAHHWRHPEIALREIRRVLKPGGIFLLIDTLTSEESLTDTWLQAIELLRDPSHVRNRSGREWRALLGACGFALLEQQDWTIRLDFASWVKRMGTPPERIEIIRALQISSPAEVQRALNIEPDGSFSIQTGLFWAQSA